MRTVLLTVLMFGVAFAEEVPQSTSRVSAGTTQASARFAPWSGSWWPMASGELGKGWNGTASFTYNSTTKQYDVNPNVAVNDLSPMAKYDRFVGNDLSRGAAKRELSIDGRWMHHVYGEKKEEYDRKGTDYSWWGHCNGWSAAAALEAEPFGPITANGIKFDVADVKGLLTESYFGCASSFTGRRYYAPEAQETTNYNRAKQLLAALGTSNVPPVSEYRAWYESAYNTTRSSNGVPNDYRGALESFIRNYDEEYTAAFEDIRPDVFHKILVKVIGQMKGVVVFDITANEAVWNYPAYAYRSTLVDKGTRSINGTSRRVFEASTTVTYSDDAVNVAHLGVKSFTRTYTYELYTTTTGLLRGGKWLRGSVNEHPDFAWYPKYNSTYADSSENRELSYGRITEILPVKNLGSEGKPFEVKANGTGSQSRRAGRSSVTWNNPVSTGRAVSLTVTAPSDVTTIRWYTQNVSVASGQPRATRDALVEIGTGRSLTANLVGKKMIVAYAYNAQGRLIAVDEITVNAQ